MCAGESTGFIDLSSGYITSWSWVFEGGVPATSNQQNPSSILYNNPGTYDVKLIIENGVNSDTLIKHDYITIYATPQITTSNDTSICEGECVTLSASGGTSYLWSTGNLTYEINVCPTTNTTYSVTITDNNGCTNSDEISVTVNPGPSAYIYVGGPVCAGECTTLQAFGGSSYTWSNGESINPINVCPSASTNYTVTVTDNNGCTESYSAPVIMNPLPLADAGPDVTITQGNSTNLTASASGGTPSYSFTWSTGGQTAQINVYPSASTTYTVTVTDINGCSDSDEVYVQVNAQTPSIITKVEPLPNLYCPDETVVVQISATNVYNVGSFSLVLNYDTAVLSYMGYTANPGLAGAVLYVNNVDTVQQVRATCFTVFSPINIGNNILLEYSFIYKASSCNLVWNTPECEYTDFSTQQQLPAAFVNGSVSGSSGPQAWAGSDKEICPGTCTQLTASGGGTYIWNTGNTNASFVVCPQVTSTYTVTVTSAVGCTASDDVTVTVNPLPTANAGTDNTICTGECIALAGSGGVSYVWSTGESTASINVCPSTTTTYSLTVSDATTCTDSDEITIFVNPVPQADAGYDKFVTIGSCIDLSATGGISYLWNTGETTENISVCPVATTIYSVTVTEENGCTDSDDVEVTTTTQSVIQTSVPNIVADSGDQVIVPVYVENFTSVASIGLGLDYDTSFLTYNNYQNLNPALAGALFTIGENGGKIIISWLSFVPVTFGNGVILELIFSYHGNSAYMKWDRTSGMCQYSDASFNILPANFFDGSVNPRTSIELKAKVFLQGAYNGNGFMNTDLNSLIPGGQPYNRVPWNYTSGEDISSTPANMTDWILLELRDKTDPTVIIARRAALLLYDGNIVDINMDSSISFTGIAADNYYLCVHHRNHMPVMSANPIAIPNASVYDFSDTLNFPPCGGGSQALIELETGIFGMISGDVNSDGTLKYSGPGNDRGLVLQRIVNETGSTNITNTINGYYDEDINMNGIVKYSGPGNDPSLIIQNLVNLTGSTSITVIFITPVP